MLRIRAAESIGGFSVRLTLTDGTQVERDLAGLLVGPAFDPLRTDGRAFESLRVEDGALVWASGADLCPDVVIWGGEAPADDAARPPGWLAPAHHPPGDEAA